MPQLPEYPHASRFEPADPANYRHWARDKPRAVSVIVLHITDGREKIAGPISWFKNPAAGVSAHFIVGQDGEIVQMVRLVDVAWHASEANSTSIGIEHVARTKGELSRKDPGLPMTEAQYRSSALLVRWLCERYGLPLDRDHIKGHNEAAKTTHKDCPTGQLDWTKFMAMVRGEG